MNIGENIKILREAKKLSQKEVITAIDMGAAQYSRIETGKTDPSISTLERIAKALGVQMVDLFANDIDLQDVDSMDKSVMEKVKLIESLSGKEKEVVYSILDAFIGKRKLKDTLTGVLDDIK